MDVRLPDGRILKNVPEGTTNEQIAQKLGMPAGNDVSRGAGLDTSKLPINPQYKSRSELVFDDAMRNVRQPGYSPSDLLGKAKNLVTGNRDREFNLPEFDLPMEASTRQVKTAAGMLMTFDPQREAEIIKANYPDIKFGQDSKGNIIADGSSYGGGVGYLNRPGLSLRDLTKAGFAVLAFTPAGKAGGLASSTAGRMATVAGASGATQAGLDAASQSMGGGVKGVDMGDVGLAALGGGVFEGIGGALARSFGPAYKGEVTPEIRQSFWESARAAGLDPEQMTDDVIRSYMDRAADSTQGAAGGEFGIRYTRGQESGDAKQLMLEDRMRNGPSGRAQNRMETFGTAQSQDVMTARDNLTRQMGPGTIERPVEAGELVSEGVRAQARAAESATHAAYDAVGQASLSVPGQKGLFARLQRIAKVNQFETHGDIAPATRRALDEITTYSSWLDNQGGLAKAQPMRRLESFRKRLDGWIDSAGNPNDKRQMFMLKREFNIYLDRAVDRSLFSGDQGAIAQLKLARGLHADYMRRFTQQDVRTRTGGKIRDEAGAAIQRMVEGDPNPEEVVNYVFGINKITGKKSGAAIAGRIRDIVGEDSPEWASLRKAAFLKLTDPGRAAVFSGARMMTHLTDAMNNSPTLLNTLFSREEQAQFVRFARAVEKAQPSIAKYGNVSRSGHKMAEYVADMWEKMVVGIGFSQAGAPGALMAKGGAEVAKEIGNLRAGLKASKATSQFRPLARINVGQYGAAGVLLSND
jgi:hypothetical protein